MPTDILCVNHSHRVSGAETSLLAVLGHLDKGRFRPALACPPGECASRFSDAGFRVFHTPLRRFKRTRSPFQLAAYYVAWRRGRRLLRKTVEDERFKLVHANGTAAQLFAGAAAQAAGVPCVWHVRDLSPLAPIGGHCARHASVAVCISRAVAEHVERETGPPPAIRIIHNGIDADDFAAKAGRWDVRSGYGWPRGAFVAVMLGQFVPWKRHEDFLGALRILAEGGQDVRGVIAGEDLFGDHPGYVARLRAMAQAPALKGRVRLVGWRSNPAMLLAAADAAVVPSEAEPFGRVALEAMAVAKPVVGARAGGLPEVVLHGKTGLLVRPKAPEELAAALNRLAAAPDEAREMGEAGRLRTREAFDIRDKARELEGVYAELLASS